MIAFFLVWASYFAWIISTSFIGLFLFYALTEYRQGKRQEREWEERRARQDQEWLAEIQTNSVLRRIYEEPYAARYLEPVGSADVIEYRKVNWKKEGF